jgi:hypothetical protein
MSESSTTLDQILAAMQQLQLENADLRNSLQALQQLQHENVDLRSSLEELQGTVLAPAHPGDLYALEPNVSLPDKFDGTRSRLRGFINQIRLIIRLQPRRYSEGFQQVGLIGTLLTGQAQAWFAPLVETSSPLLTNFQAFLTEFEATFGETDKRRTALNKLYALQQGNRAASVYASEFRQISCDVEWDGQALLDQFRRGLRGEIKHLLLNFPEPTSLNEAITQAVRCDNRLFEFRQEERPNRFNSTWSSITPSQPATRSIAMPPTLSSPSASTPMVDSSSPMEIDRIRYKPLTNAQRQHRRANNLCLYCGSPDHMLRSCTKKGPRQTPHRVDGVEIFNQSENNNVQLQ